MKINDQKIKIATFVKKKVKIRSVEILKNIPLHLETIQ